MYGRIKGQASGITGSISDVGRSVARLVAAIGWPLLLPCAPHSGQRVVACPAVCSLIRRFRPCASSVVGPIGLPPCIAGFCVPVSSLRPPMPLSRPRRRFVGRFAVVVVPYPPPRGGGRRPGALGSYPEPSQLARRASRYSVTNPVAILYTYLSAVVGSPFQPLVSWTLATAFPPAGKAPLLRTSYRPSASFWSIVDPATETIA